MITKKEWWEATKWRISLCYAYSDIGSIITDGDLYIRLYGMRPKLKDLKKQEVKNWIEEMEERYTS